MFEFIQLLITYTQLLMYFIQKDLSTKTQYRLNSKSSQKYIILKSYLLQLYKETPVLKV